MRITELTAYNYKSLREVTIRPRAFNVLVGPNDSGKSNLADCLGFLAEVYRGGLRAAITNKGGFDSLVFRQPGDGTRASIGISLCLETRVRREMKQSDANSSGRLRFKHEFHFGKREAGVREEYYVEREQFFVSIVSDGEEEFPLFAIKRSEQTVEVDSSAEWDRIMSASEGFPWKNIILTFNRLIPSSELLIPVIADLEWVLNEFTQYVQRVRVYQISPLAARRSPARGAEPQLDRYGENLPVVIDVLQRRSPRTWKKILSVMRRLNSRLEEIVVVNIDEQLRLLFQEAGSNRPWAASQVSDGTIQSLALLTAIFDPNNRFLVLEEPENSVHPWIIRNIVDACRSASRRKQILLTTHSPVLIDAVKPSEVWLISRDQNGSTVQVLDEVEPGIERSWREGEISISEFLDSGAVEMYVPAGVRSFGSPGDDDPQEEDD